MTRNVLEGIVVKRGYTAAYEREVLIAWGADRFSVRYDDRRDSCTVWEQGDTAPATESESLVLIRIAEAAGVRPTTR